ncbi:hypothetical protein PSFL_44380 [Pseudomonas sp. DD1]
MTDVVSYPKDDLRRMLSVRLQLTLCPTQPW